MWFFSDRLKLENQYKIWIKENKLEDNAFNVITYLAISGYLIEPKGEQK